MGCLPDSGGCERPFIEPFIEHLNETEGCAFTHSKCLDVQDRTRTQPEAMYIDTRTNAQLVIERKSLVWPADAVARHKNEHLIGDSLGDALRDLTSDLPIDIRIWPIAPRSKHELQDLSATIANAVRASISELKAGQLLHSGHGDPQWTCWINPDERAEDDERDSGLIVRFAAISDLGYPDLKDPGLHQEVQRLVTSAASKFQAYPMCRRVLLLDTFGDVRFIEPEGFSRLLGSVAIPKEISEIWTGSFDWVTDDDQAWMFERILPTQTSLPVELH